MVQMSNTEVALNSSVRQPTVNYQSALRMPDMAVQNRVSEPKTDWVNYALSEGGRALDAYGKYASGMAQITSEKDAAEKKAAEEKATNIQKTALARAVNRLVEKRKQTGDNTGVATEMRNLIDSALAAGMDTKDISEITKAYGSNIFKQEGSKYQKLQDQEIDWQKEQDQDYVKKFPTNSNLSMSQVRAKRMERQDSVERFIKYQSYLNSLPRGSEMYKQAKATYDIALKNDIVGGLLDHITQASAGKGVTPETLQEIKTIGLKHYASLNADVNEAAEIMDEYLRQKGFYTVNDNYIQTGLITQKAMTDALNMSDLEAKMYLDSIPGYTISRIALGDAYKEAMANEAVRIGLDKAMARYTFKEAGMVKEVTDEKGKTTLAPDMTGLMLKGTNNLYANGSSTPYMRSVWGIETIKLVNSYNQVSPSEGEADRRTSLNNIKGVKNVININAMRRDAEILKKSDIPAVAAVGEMYEEEINTLEGKEAAGNLLEKSSPLYETVKGLQESLNTSELKYDEDGKLFLTGTSGILGGISSIIRGHGGEGSYEVQLERLNKGLEKETPENRKAILNALGWSKADVGDIDILNTSGSEVLEQTRQQQEENMPGANFFSRFGSDVRQKYNDAANRPGVKVAKAYFSRNPDNTVEDYRGNINLEERPVYENEDGSISTENSITIEEDGVYTVIPTIRTENGKRIDMSDDEAIKYYHKTGEHLGQFDNLDDANEQAMVIHNRFEDASPTVSKASASATMTFENAYPSIQKTSENAEDYDVIKNAFEAKKKALGYRDYLYQRQAGFRDSTGSDLKEDWSEEIEEQEKIIKDSDDIIAKGLNKLQGKAPQEEDKSIDGLVNRYSKEFGVEAKQVLAILKRESAGDEKAVSKAGARGLMQLMPDTFEEVKRELKLPKDADIFDPEINIRAGTYYFSKMMKQFNGDVNKALAAYNWGPGNVRRAIRTYGDDWFEGARTKGIVVDGKRRYLPDETLKYVSALGKLYA